MVATVRDLLESARRALLSSVALTVAGGVGCVDKVVPDVRAVHVYVREECHGWRNAEVVVTVEEFSEQSPTGVDYGPGWLEFRRIEHAGPTRLLVRVRVEAPSEPGLPGGQRAEPVADCYIPGGEEDEEWEE